MCKFTWQTFAAPSCILHARFIQEFCLSCPADTNDSSKWTQFVPTGTTTIINIEQASKSDAAGKCKNFEYVESVFEGPRGCKGMKGSPCDEGCVRPLMVAIWNTNGDYDGRWIAELPKLLLEGVDSVKASVEEERDAKEEMEDEELFLRVGVKASGGLKKLKVVLARGLSKRGS